MRKFAIRSAKPKEGGESRPSEGGFKGFLSKRWCLISLLLIIAIAFIIRFVWSYGISAGDSYALSGGSDATGHLNVVESILNGSFSLTDSALNYPYGSLNVVPPLVDFIAAGVAGVGTLFGVSTEVAAAGALAWLAPIFGVLTCIPVFLVAKKMFKDEKVAIISALIYVLFASMIMNTVFSNGTELAFVGFMFAWMVYFLYSALVAVDGADPGFKSLWQDKAVLKNTLIAGICLALIALAWNRFEVIVTLMVVLIVVQAIIDRLRGKETLALTALVYSVTLMIGLLIAAVFYIPAGLWDLVFSGVFLKGVIVVALALFFCFTAKKSWVIMLPVTIVIGVVIMVALFFAAPDLFSAIIGGNSIYEDSLMQGLISFNVTSISEMAAYFGWVTLWLPVALFLYMLYKIRKNMDSRAYTFIMIWLIGSFCMTWYSYNYAPIAAVAIAVGSAVVIMKLIRFSQFKDYFHGLKGNGIVAGAKKAIKPIPLFTLVVLIGLIIAPNALYAVDAGMPTNSESDDGYFGGLGYTINTEDSSMVSEFWSDYGDEDKSGALATWFGYSNEAVTYGNFQSITDARGNGASAASNMLTSDGSAATLSAMAIRLMMSGDISDYGSAITAAGLNYDKIEGYFNDPCSAVDEILNDGTTYHGVDVDITCENAVYLTVENYITETLSEPEISSFYDDVCNVSGDKISYVMVNGSMLPMYYGDNSYFSTIAYFNNYVIDAYGAPEEFYKYNTNTGYAEYTDAMYETFFWKSLIGITQTSAGHTSTISFLSALALSDGSLKAVPGYGLSNYKVAYWAVQYNADDDAELSSSGWEYMNAYEAIELQNNEGGMINYLSSIVLMEYVGETQNTVEGTIQYTAATGDAPASGIQVAVFEKVNYDSSGITNYVQRNTTYTDGHGQYQISVPSDGTDYYVVFSSGTKTMTGGTVIATFTGTVPSTYTMNATNITGNIVSSEDTAYAEFVYVDITGIASGKTYQSDANNGAFSFDFVVPDTYTATVYMKDGSTVTTDTIVACVGSNVGAQITIGSATITVTVNNEYGAAMDVGTIVAVNTTTGNTVTAEVVDGTAVLTVAAPASTVYSLSATNGIINLSPTDVTVTSEGTRTATMTVCESSRTITVTGAEGLLVTLMSSEYTATSSNGSFAVPTSGGPNNTLYTAYATDGSKAYVGSTTGDTIVMGEYNACTVSGTMTDQSGDATSGKIVFMMDSGAQITASPDADGKYSIMLPGGSYTVWAYDSEDSAYLGSVAISNTMTYDISLKEARTLTITLNYRTQMSSSSTKGVSYVDVNMTTTVDNTDYAIVLQTNNSGVTTFYVPVNCEFAASIPAMDTATFYMEEQNTTFAAGTGDSSYSCTITGSKADNEKMYVKEVMISSTYEVHLVQYTDSTVTYDVHDAVSVEPGQYTATVKGSTGFYFNGTVYVYPGTAGELVMDPISVSTVTVASGAQDEITVTPIANDDDEKGEYHVDPDDSKLYYMENGFGYTFKATSGSTATTLVAYGYIADLTGAMTVDLNNKAEPITVSGYVGVVADGTLTVTYDDVQLTFAIDDGAYEAELIAGKAMTFSVEVKQTLNSNDCTYTATKLVTADEMVDEAKINFYVTTSDMEPTVSELSGSNFSFVNGAGSFTLSIENTGKVAKTYYITPGTAWILDRTYTLTVDAESTGTIDIEGSYNPVDVGAGDVNLSVLVRDITDNSVGTYVVDTSSMTQYGSTVPVYVDIAGTDDASSDSVNSYEYMYAVTITNDGNTLRKATVNAIVNNEDWIFKIADSNGAWIMDSGSTFDVIGYDTTVIYVKLMSSTGGTGATPGVSITVTLDEGTVQTNSSPTVTVSGATASMSLTAATANIEVTDMTATGDDIYMESSTIPTTFWVLLALCVLALLAILWMGMKRGVFVRKK